MRSIICCVFLIALSASAEDLDQYFKGVKNRAIYVVSKKGKVLYSQNEEISMIPASTMKVFTVGAALKILGEDFRFKTEVVEGESLGIKGYGSNLNSEELALLAKKIAKKSYRDIIIDPSYFKQNLEISGKGNSNNPYDAVVTSISVNYNTVNLLLNDGAVYSAESQTPTIKFLSRFKPRLKSRKPERISILQPEEAYLYFGELFREFLKQEGVEIAGEIKIGSINDLQGKKYQWRSKEPLNQLSKSLLQYSTNLSANQLFLTLGAAVNKEPATIQKSRNVLEDFWYKNRVDLKAYDGAGLSRDNRITAKELVRGLKFLPEGYLPDEGDGILAKTGTLNAVSTLVGTFEDCPINYSIMIMEEVNFNLRFKLAKIIKREFCRQDSKS